ncbi:H-NS family nucleoid-associated regulatory protein [Rhodoferax antarcticus]|uniref:Histone family protein nucleoid-structuring protein n=1 Tax=Rhodoferax antarcticus ANT.BR TaxID=1111071 RepID=A0A1Q8Y970_9BURK|nr:H-NS histone family protein [Rhodoferax antarcticus]OLP04519.1 Histone family protein nucleoid-structuring protein [Rhodoferax antarcticus ANT.BR]
MENENLQTLNEIELQIEALKERANQIRATELASVISDVNQKIAAYALRPGDLKFKSDAIRIESNKVGKKAEVKYRDSEGQTWSGRGLKPRWLTAAIEGGKVVEDFLV